MSFSTIWYRTPTGTKVGAIAAILGFIISVYDYSETTSGGVVTQCSYTDYTALLAAAIAGIAAAAGLVQNSRRHENVQLPNQAMIPATLVLLALAVVHVFRGFGTIGGMC